MIRVEVKNEILGDSIFWEGQPENVEEIRNIVARQLAKQTVKDGRPHNSGMWFVSVVV